MVGQMQRNASISNRHKAERVARPWWLNRSKHPFGLPNSALFSRAATSNQDTGQVLPVYTWAGIYLGINGAWGWGNVKWIANTVDTFPGATGFVGDTLDVNWQASAFVFAVEDTWDYSGIDTGTTSSICTFTLAHN